MHVAIQKKIHQKKCPSKVLGEEKRILQKMPKTPGVQKTIMLQKIQEALLQEKEIIPILEKEKSLLQPMQKAKRKKKKTVLQQVWQKKKKLEGGKKKCPKSELQSQQAGDQKRFHLVLSWSAWGKSRRIPSCSGFSSSQGSSDLWQEGDSFDSPGPSQRTCLYPSPWWMDTEHWVALSCCPSLSESVQGVSQRAGCQSPRETQDGQCKIFWLEFLIQVNFCNGGLEEKSVCSVEIWLQLLKYV